MDLPGAGTRYETALKRCVEQIGWYERHARRARVFYRTFQSAVVVLAGLTPVLALWEKAPELVQVLPAAIASIAAAIIGLWSWQENWVRFAATAEALKSELLRLQTRTSEAYEIRLDEETVLDNFVARIKAWRPASWRPEAPDNRRETPQNENR